MSDKTDLTSDLSFTIIGDRKVTQLDAEVIMAKDTKERILMAALDMFSKKGYEGTNIRELAASLELVKSGMLGLMQWIRRKSIAKVDRDILLLGGYYILVILGYLIFEMIPINYRPILIDGAMEASYPSSTTLLVLSVMPTLLFQVNRRAKSQMIRRITVAFVILFSAFMVIGRLVAGVHWLTDIVGSVLLSAGLYCLYRITVTAMDHS